MTTIQRLLTEPLIRTNLAAIDHVQRQAQIASNVLMGLPVTPMLDRDVEAMLDARDQLYLALRVANEHQANLARIVKFYLSTY